jgi:hypothetical protein
MSRRGKSVLAAFLFLGMTGEARADLYWTDYVSEEDGPALCNESTEGAVGFACTGDYCDNVALLCESFPYGALAPSWNGYLTAFFSEEHDGFSTWYSSGWYRFDNENYEVCHNHQSSPGVLTGIDCSGDYCDNISLECRQPEGTVSGVYRKLNATNCSWSGWYSEEQGSVDFGMHRYITGVECSGDYCDNKRFYVCSLY